MREVDIVVLVAISFLQEIGFAKDVQNQATAKKEV